MKAFLGDDFLLDSPTAERLFHYYSNPMPIIDYHCHLSPEEIYENKTYKNITEVWLYGDHYKWRVMRANGIEEAYITGDASDYDKFLAWAKTVPQTIGNPLYQWSHLELRRFFGVEELINENNAPVIWEKVNEQLQGEDFGARDFIRKSNVDIICTTDDPTDSLEFHLKLKEDTSFATAVYPTFRPDKGLELNRKGFAEWVQKLADVSGKTIGTYDDFLNALESRVEFFHSVGGRLSDHALDYVPYAKVSKEEATGIFSQALKGVAVSREEEEKYKTYTLMFLGKLYTERDWVMQYHMNALRNNNSHAVSELGPDTGFDAINDESVAKPLSRLLDTLEKENALPKTIFYSLNPNDNHILATLMGCFQEGGVVGKMQFGSAWWFNDTKEGMLNQMTTLAEVGLLSRFVGMLTDSRSFLSYTRHEYFRRLLCNLIGGWVESGEFPADMNLLGDIVQNVSYNNAKQYFGLEVKSE